jgi:hypothetical protein
MNTYGPVIFLLFLTIGCIGLMSFMNLGNLIVSSFRKPSPVRLPERSETEERVQLRRRSHHHPNIICMLPMYEQKRPEQPLW